MDQVLLLDAGRKLQHWNVATGEVLYVGAIPVDFTLSDVTVTPDGRIFVVANSTLYELDPDTLEATVLADLGGDRASGLGHTPEGMLLVSYGDASRIDEMDPETLEIVNTIDMGEAFTLGDLVADADSIYVATQNLTIDVYDRATGTLQSSTPHGLGGIVFGLSYNEGVIAYANGIAYRVETTGVTVQQELGLAVPVYGATTLPDALHEGTAEAETLNGAFWNDTLRGNGGNDTINGGGGEDTALYAGPRSQYSVVIEGDNIRIEDRSGAEGTDELNDVETLSFDDQDWRLDIFDDISGLSAEDFTQFVEMYIAYFNRAPDSEGLFFWGSALNNGTALEDIAALFFDQDETRAQYPDGTTTGEFVQSVYGNVLGREIDQLGFDFWVGVLDAGDVDRPTFMLEIIRGAKAPAPAGASQDFIDQKADDVAYLANKADLGTYFSVILGMRDVENARSVMDLYDGTPESLGLAITATDGFYADALDANTGEFLLSLVGVVDDPFMML